MSEVTSVLYDHYKETCSILTNAIKKRERSVLLVTAAAASFAIYALSPEPSADALGGFLNSAYGIDTTLNFAALGSVIWFLLLVFTLRYFQISVFIERQYEYIHQLEEKLNSRLGEDVVTREGKSYLSNYPKFSDWVWLLYTILFPLILLVITFVKIAREWYVTGLELDKFVILDSIFFGLLVVTVVLYLIKIHFSNESE